MKGQMQHATASGALNGIPVKTPAKFHEDGYLEQFFSSLLEVDCALRASFGRNLISHEFRLIFQLSTKKKLIVKDAALSSQLSSRAFYELLKKMEQDGIVHSQRDNGDKRAKSICLSPEFATQLKNEFAARTYALNGHLNPAV